MRVNANRAIARELRGHEGRRGKRKLEHERPRIVRNASHEVETAGRARDEHRIATSEMGAMHQREESPDVVRYRAHDLIG